MVQWLRICFAVQEMWILIPGKGTKISHVVCHPKMKKKKRIAKIKSIPGQETKILHVFQPKKKKTEKNIVADSRLKMSIF